MSKQIYSTKQVASILHISLRTLYRYTRDGLISYSQIGRKLFFTDEDVSEFLSQYKKETFTKQLKQKSWTR